ncbi:hypothetical protein [Hahella ganghwensis]|uniref:hypothetical protein n=1 Tax=Hahella ganghwensis TaxID=286420 RepID=UPI0012F852AC|nr:hypothetical protein [Hahella ganghwensis]
MKANTASCLKQIHTLVDRSCSIKGLQIDLSRPASETLRYSIRYLSSYGYRNSGGTINMSDPSADVRVSRLLRDVKEAISDSSEDYGVLCRAS